MTIDPDASGLIRRTWRKLRGAAEAESRRWYVQCECGKEPSMWEMGGIRFMAAGNPRRLVKCPYCGKRFMGKLLKRPQDGQGTDGQPTG